MAGEVNGESGVQHHQVTVITLAYDHETCVVSLGCHDVNLALAQMMVHEATVQLDTMRRQAAAMELKQRIDAAAADAAIRAAISKGKGRA